VSPRIPGRHDQPLERVDMTPEAILQFQHDIATGYDGQAQWRRDCTCNHAKRQHERGIGGCGMRCGCRQYDAGQNERLDLWLHPDAAQWLPEWVVVEAIGNRYSPEGLVQFRLRRDFNSAAVQVVRAGVRQTTYRPEGAPE
jgi:hypothetical protein